MKNFIDKKEFTKKEAIAFLSIPEKDFDNYFSKSKEIKGYKIGARWFFNKKELERWSDLRNERTIELTLNEYEKCFEFAIKMVYGGLSLHGIRGERSEVQATDDVILGILAEHAIKKFLKEKFDTEIKLDEKVHTAYITPQDFDYIKDGKIFRKPKLGIGVKASKTKNSYLVLGENEAELPGRKSDVYIFARVGLPSDHLFRILRDHSFFKRVKNFLENAKGFKKILKLEKIPIWICGFLYHGELEKKNQIPGQKFDNGCRYVKSVADMHNLDDDWRGLIAKI
jgi:hypothetical protein